MVKPPCLLPLTSLSFPSLSSPLLSDHAWSLCMTVCITSWPCYSLPTPAASKWFHVHLDNRLNCYINGLNSFQHYPNVHEPLLDFSLALLRSVIWPSLGAVHTSHIDVIFRLKMQYIADSCAQHCFIYIIFMQLPLSTNCRVSSKHKAQDWLTSLFLSPIKPCQWH